MCLRRSKLFSPVKLSTWLPIVFTVVYLTRDTIGYNIDIDNVKVFDDPVGLVNTQNSYFGFSVALYVNSNDSVLLVGAPRANSSKLLHVVEPGTVYHCSLDGTCKEWIISNSGNGRFKKNYSFFQIKDNAWIGATILVENKKDPRVVVCGPRWKNNIIQRGEPHWYMNGICYWTIVTNARSFEMKAAHEIAPLTDYKKQVYKGPRKTRYDYGMSQFGFSGHITSEKRGSNLVLGSPGVHNWKGVPVLLNDSWNHDNRVIIPSVILDQNIQDVTYFGYALTSGRYFKSDELFFASSAPRGTNLNGNVLVFQFPSDTNNQILVNKLLSGLQYGEYFGAAMTSCDLNQDGRQELIVGAPHWARDVDEGRIYIFITRHSTKFAMHYIEGEISGGRFGTSVTCLGDIDRDGYEDIAVGAPYEMDTGAIYIFNGNSNGLLTKYSQKILGSQLEQGIRGFGISISEPKDVNRDHYADIAVGAYLSKKVILLKSKPVITINTRLSYKENKNLSPNSTLFYIDMCTWYNGEYVPESLRIVKLLTIDQLYERATIGNNTKGNDSNINRIPATIYKSQEKCTHHEIRLKRNIQNIVEPIEILASVILENNTQLHEGERKHLPAVAINKRNSKTEALMKLPFALGCGNDNVCTTNLSVILSTDLTSDNKYIIGSTPTVKLHVNVYNYADPAYQIKVYVYISQVLSLAMIPSDCMESTMINDMLEIVCNVGYLLRQNKTFTLELDMSHIRYDIGSIELWANVTSQGKDTDLSDNTYNLTMHFGFDIDIAIAGKAQEDLYSYFRKDEEKSVDTIRFQHMYQVQKFGASPIEEAALTIEVPVYWKHFIGDIEIVNINQTIGYLDGQLFSCTYTNSTETSEVPVIYKASTHSAYTGEQSTQAKFMIEDDESITLPSENRTLYLNCSNNNVKCKKVKCNLGAFTNSMSVAKLSLTFDFQLMNFQPDMMEGKDIILVVSSGSVNIIQPYNVTQKKGHKPDSTAVATTFLGSPPVEKISTWIIILSILLGIVLLMLLIWGLVKVGFFNRKKKEELEALKAEADEKHEMVLETCSTQEILDQEKT